jgi:integrase
LTQTQEGTPKTSRGQRSVALDPGTVRALRTWRKHQLEERLAWGAAWTDSGRVFTREDGTDLHPTRVSEQFDALVRQSGLPRIRLHDLRHGHATLALAAGVHPKVVQERLGHSSVAFTLDRYSHVIPAMQEDAAETVARLVNHDQEGAA